MREKGRIAAALAALGALLFGCREAAADDLKLMQLGMALGRVIGAEQACGLAYDQAAIAAWIAKRVPADDLEFAGHVDTGVGATRYQLQTMSQSEITALCAQTARAAKAYGFTP